MKLNASTILTLLGWLALAVWTVSRLNTIQEYQERALTEIKVSLDKIQARIDMHVDQSNTAGPVRPR